MLILMYNDVRQREQWQLQHQLLCALRDFLRVVRPLAPLIQFLPRTRKLRPRHQTTLIGHYRWKKLRNCRFEQRVRSANQQRQRKNLAFPQPLQRRQRKMQRWLRRVPFLRRIHHCWRKLFVLLSTRTRVPRQHPRPKLELVRPLHLATASRIHMPHYPWANVTEQIRPLWINCSVNQQLSHRSNKRWNLSRRNPIFQVNRWTRHRVNRAWKRINNKRNY